MCLNDSESEDSTSKMGINTSKTHSNMNKIIISVVCVFVIIVTVVIGMLGIYFYKRLRKTSGNFKIVLKYNLFSTCHFKCCIIQILSVCVCLNNSTCTSTCIYWFNKISGENIGVT